MKNQTISRIILFVFAFGILLSCKKSDAINPASPADAMVGNYTMTQVVSQGQVISLPYNQAGNQLNGTLTISKIAPTTVSVSFILNQVLNGVKSSSSDNAQVEIKQNGNSIDLSILQIFLQKLVILPIIF